MNILLTIKASKKYRLYATHNVFALILLLCSSHVHAAFTTTETSVKSLGDIAVTVIEGKLDQEEWIDKLRVEASVICITDLYNQTTQTPAILNDVLRKISKEKLSRFDQEVWCCRVMRSCFGGQDSVGWMLRSVADGAIDIRDLESFASQKRGALLGNCASTTYQLDAVAFKHHTKPDVLCVVIAESDCPDHFMPYTNVVDKITSCIAKSTIGRQR